MAELRTADLSDEYSDILQYVEPIFKDYGARKTFGGKVSTVKCFEDNVLVKTALSEQGNGRVRTGLFKSLSLEENFLVVMNV